MNIQNFATKHRLKSSRDECGDIVILGRIGQSNIYEYSDTQLGVMFITDGNKEPRTQLWNKFKDACIRAEMTLRQSGDAEGSFSFDPTDNAQAKIAIKGIRARAKRQRTPEQIAKFLEVTRPTRFFRPETVQNELVSS